MFALCSKRFLPTLGNAERLETVILQQSLQPFARPIAVAGKDDRAPGLSERLHMGRDSVVDIFLPAALGREVARWLDCEVDRPPVFWLGERRRQVNRLLSEEPV